MNNKQRILSLIAILFITMLVVSGSTFAYMQWVSSGDQETALDITVTEKINMHIDSPGITKTGMHPTNDCAGDAGMSGVSTITIENQTGVLAAPRFKLKVKITDSNGNVITNEKSTMDVQKGTNNPFRYYIRYAVSRHDLPSCDGAYLSTGRFDVNQATVNGSTDWYDSDWITLLDDSGFPLVPVSSRQGVSFNVNPYTRVTEKYQLSVWLDSAYTTVVSGNETTIDKLQDATVEVSFSQNSTVEQKRKELVGDAYAIYSTDDNYLRFTRSETPIAVGDSYKGKTVTNVYTGFENVDFTSNTSVPWRSVRENVTAVLFEGEIRPTSTRYWFYEFVNCGKFTTANWLDTSQVTDMSRMFYKAGQNVTTTLYIRDMDEWNTSNVTNMYGMFEYAGENTDYVEISGLSAWDVSNVTDMSRMFSGAGQNGTSFHIDSLHGWDTSNVTDMSYMFNNTGKSSRHNWGLDLSTWNVNDVFYWYNFDNGVTSHITAPNWVLGDTYYAIITENTNSFYYDWDKAGNAIERLNVGDMYRGYPVKYKYTLYSHRAINDGPLPWVSENSFIYRVYVIKTPPLFNIHGMFSDFNYANYLEISQINTSNVTDMTGMFAKFGYYNNSSSIQVRGLNSIDTSSVTSMGGMFSEFGYRCTGSITGFDQLRYWNVSNVTNMMSMFSGFGYNANNIVNFYDLSDWDTSSLMYMSGMFSNFGRNLQNSLTLDLSNWDVCKNPQNSSPGSYAPTNSFINFIPPNACP